MTNRRTHQLWLLVSIFAGAAIQANASNIVMDPSFETGIANSYTGAIGDGWLVTAGTGAICNISGAGCGSAGVAHTGDQMAFLDWSTTFDTLSQTLTTVVGQTYTVSYWVAGTQANLLEVAFGGSTLFDGTSPTGSVSSAGDYVQYSFDVTATSTSTELAFSGERTAGGEVLLDDVSVTATPEPSALPLVGLCLLAMVAYHVGRKFEQA